MDSEELRQLVNGGEKLDVEFKRAPGLSDDAIVEAAVCLTNGPGGRLLLGVEDDGTVTGCPPRHGDITDPAKIQGLILNRTNPPLSTRAEIVHDSEGGVDVVVVTVPDEAHPVGTQKGKYLRRTINHDGTPRCSPFFAHEMFMAGVSAMGRDYAESVMHGPTPEDLDPAEFRRFRAYCQRATGDDVLADAADAEILRALRLIHPTDPDVVTIGALLLFGTTDAIRRYVPTAEILFQEMRGTTVVASHAIHAPLFRGFEEIQDLLEPRNTEQELMIGIQRIGVPKVPPATVRELVANALIHRDYSMLGPVHVQWHPDHVRVSSPGGLPRGITLTNLLDDSCPRSPVLAEAFRRAGVVDRAGRGIARMYTDLLRAGRSAPDYSQTHDTAVIVTVDTSDADLEMVRFVLEYERETQAPLNLEQLQMLHELKAYGPQTVPELAESTKRSADALRRQGAKLVELGLADFRGHSARNRRLHLTPYFHRAARSSEYVRTQSLEPLQQEQMVLTYVEAHGRITRREAADLCRITPDQARAMLRGLVEAGRLELRGQKRGAHYVRPERGDG